MFEGDWRVGLRTERSRIAMYDELYGSLSLQ